MGIYVSWPPALAPGPNLYLPTMALNLYLPVATFNLHLPAWLVIIGNNKSKSLDIMLLLLFFCFSLSNPCVVVMVDRNDTKGNLSNNQINKYN